MNIYILLTLALSLCILGNCVEPVTPVSEKPSSKVNYPSNFQVENGWDLFVSGEYLYWTAKEDGLYFAQTGLQNQTLSLPPHGSGNFNGKLKKIDPDWDQGLRVGLGLNFPKEGYSITAYWTWFKTESENSAHGLVIPLWAEPDLIPFTAVTQAKAKWNLNLNIADLEWGRSSWFGGSFSLRPFFALRGIWTDQSLRIQYTYATIPRFSSNLHSNGDFCGGGLRVGGEGRFALPAGFGIYGIASGSLLYGKLNADLRIATSAAAIARTRDHFWKGVSSMQLGLGLGWDTHFHKDRLHIEFHAGWESNLWFGINQMNHFLNQLSNGSYFKEKGNLSTQGLVAGGRFDF